MKHDELQAIADAIISSNDTLIYLNILIILIAVISIYFFGLLNKSGELTAIKMAFEDIKYQNKVITSETEGIKRQLEKGTIEYQIKLSKYHEKKIDAIEKIHSKLADLLNCSRRIILSSNEETYNNFNHIAEAFQTCFESQKLWLDASISREIEKFAIEIDKQVREYQGVMSVSKLPGLQEKIIEQIYDKQDDFYKFTAERSTKLKNQLEELLRTYLSPETKA